MDTSLYLQKFKIDTKPINEVFSYCDKIYKWAGSQKGTFPAIRRAINLNGKEAGRRFCLYQIERNEVPDSLLKENRLRYFYGYIKQQGTILTPHIK